MGFNISVVPGKSSRLRCPSIQNLQGRVFQRGVVQRPKFGRLPFANMATAGNDVAAKFGWDPKVYNGEAKPDYANDPQVHELPVAAIRRPVPRSNNQEKVEALMESIERVGLQEPIDVLEVDGVYYGFSGCHRFEAHQKLGKEKILCKVRKANRQVLRFHMM